MSASHEDIQQWVVDEPYIHLPCKLGEGPHYNAASNTLRFLDINSSLLYMLDLTQGPSSLRKIRTGVPIGVTADIAGEDASKVILCGAKDGVTKFHLPDAGDAGDEAGEDGGQHEYLVRYWAGLPQGKANDQQDGKVRRMRANDGGVDTRGRLWVETFVDPEIDSEGTGEGVLWRLDVAAKDDDGGGGRGGSGSGSGSGSVKTPPTPALKMIMDNMTIPNGISWTHGDKWMYLTDSPAQRVYRFPYDAQTGEVDVADRDRRVWYHLDEPGVFPDGHALDVEGNLWHACYGGGKVLRISPDPDVDGARGTVTGVVRLPTKNVTCPVFVGTELFITTARDKSDDGSGGVDGERSRRFGGSLFKVDVGVRGVEKREVRLG